MADLKPKAMTREEALAAVRAIPVEKNFVWDGKTEDDRPATEEEMRAGVAAYQRRGGLPQST